MIKKILNLQTKNITSAAFILGAVSLISAGLGLFRDRLLAGNFGIGRDLDIYYTAFRIPDFISMVLIMGAISAAIIPIFSQYLVNSKEQAFQFLANLFNLFLFLLVVAIFILIIFTPQLINLIAPGFSGEEKDLTIWLTRIMLLSPVLLGISNIISAVLQVFQKFLITSLAPVMYNLGIIFGILFLVPWLGIFGLAWGVVLGGFLHLLIQAPVLFQTGFRPLKILEFLQPGFLKVVKLTIPRSIGLAASQINLIVITAIASTLAGGSIAVFNLAESISRPLLTFIGISFSTAAFPALSSAFSRKQKQEFNQIFSLVFSRILYLILPLSLLLFLFRNLIVGIILKVGKFGLVDVKLTAACLGAFSLGIFAQGLVILIAKAFYSVQDTKTPAIVAVAGMLFNIILSFTFVWLFSFNNSFQGFFLKFLGISNLAGIEVIALPLAVSFSAIFQFLLLLFLFYQKKSIFNKNNF
jgi:putative peptidoglycan lipid II flippase